jgi:hypothetical protein
LYTNYGLEFCAVYNHCFYNPAAVDSFSFIGALVVIGIPVTAHTAPYFPVAVREACGILRGNDGCDIGVFLCVCKVYIELT